MSKCCGRCARQCGHILDKVSDTVTTVRMSQATYEAATGEQLQVQGIDVIIDQTMRDGEVVAE